MLALGLGLGLGLRLRLRLRLGRLRACLAQAAAACDHDCEEEAARDGLGRDGAQQHVELLGLEVHRRVDEAEAVVRGARLGVVSIALPYLYLPYISPVSPLYHLVARGRRVVVGLVEDGVVRGQAAQRERDRLALDQRLAPAHVHDHADGLGLRQREQHKVAAVLGAPVAARGEHVVQNLVREQGRYVGDVWEIWGRYRGLMVG